MHSLFFLLLVLMCSLALAYIYKFWIVLFVFHILLSRFGYASCSGIEFVYIFDSEEVLV